MSCEIQVEPSEPVAIGLASRNKSEESTTQRLAEQVFDYVVAKITEGKYAPSDKLSQRELAKELVVSRVPVREAMEMLEQNGWIERFPRRGTFISSFTRREIDDLYQIREVFEAEAVRFLARNITEEQLAELQAVVDRLVTASKENDTRAYAAADTEFHRLLVYLVGNERMYKLYESALLQTRCFLSVGALRVAYVWEENIEQQETIGHKCLFDAIAARDPERAVRLLRDHLQVGRDFARLTQAIPRQSSRES